MCQQDPAVCMFAESIITINLVDRISGFLTPGTDGLVEMGLWNIICMRESPNSTFNTG